MHLNVGEARSNVAAAVRMYLEKYPRLRLVASWRQVQFALL
jgi:hypothetical protein